MKCSEEKMLNRSFLSSEEMTKKGVSFSHRLFTKHGVILKYSLVGLFIGSHSPHGFPVLFIIPLNLLMWSHYMYQYINKNE